MWVDPEYDDHGTPGLSGSSIGGGQPDGIGIAIASADTGGPTTTIILDEIKIGYTWGDLVPAAGPPPLVSEVEITPAVRIRWQTIVGETYQPQFSHDLRNWFNFGPAVAGNGQAQELFDSVDQTAKRFYRVQTD